MTGETDLATLISQMRPMLDPEPYVFCTFASKSMTDLAEYDPIGLFAETEGLTAILPVERARELGLAEAEWFRRITLTVHSSLEAVGLTASISAALATEGISANVVAAYFHDHVFVPEERADDALAALRKLAGDI
ncbi:ACT domain protein [Labrenzia sp. THAF191b]|uniref:ACT domain-containing protein n=1 Tax=unclassified Labrenzia TaxID=2648686 RepID=UPI001267B9CF|nr:MULTISPECIES: ACT domain-containing protein [unclassified Labrenzia]QFS99571.1 ACT domain protein [Labrenzia sp. THAF191b]QFT05885.1 ACT domain protein [Labrenzia sp. THAF191a]QFT17429.1 ACT domain protein [Labrenzia sp. THAF187b]